jgi:nucleotide-binding universal stress UspA family protein
MAYVAGWEHDVFVSYAHLDNIPLSPGELGWVDELAEKLQTEVSQRLGTKDFCLWIDRSLDGNHPITPDIVKAIQQSATLLVIMSPGYLNSEWCAKERTAFLNLIGDRVAAGRVFVAFARNVDRSQVPKEFGDLVGFQFWIDDRDACTDRPLGMPDSTEKAYISKVLQLSHDLGAQLSQLRSSAGHDVKPNLPAPQPSDGPYVFVARTTDDLDEREDELKGYLSQAKINVLPQTWYPQTDRSAFEAAMRRDLERCKVFAQLLSTSRGKELGFLPISRPPRLQYDIAMAVATPVRQWRDRALDLDAVKDPDHRALLESAQASGFEEFKRAVLDEAVRVPETVRTASANVMVFVNAESADRQLAEAVGKALMEHDVECYWPLASGSPEAVRRDLEENLGSCDGVLLIYGASGADWIRNQLRQGRKIISQRTRPLAALAVYEGPPTAKEDLSVAIPNLIRLDCRNGFAADAIKPFIQSLRS